MLRGEALVEARGDLWQFVQETMKRMVAVGMEPDDVTDVVKRAADDWRRREAEAGRAEAGR